MRRAWWVAVLVLLAVALTPAPGVHGDDGDRAITYLGAVRDRPDLRSLGIGREGAWFPQFDVDDLEGEVADGAVGDNAHDTLPPWIAAFNYTTDPADAGCGEPDALIRGCAPTYLFRTFSGDGPARSERQAGWSLLRLPSGVCGQSGAIVDPHTSQQGDHPQQLDPNTNNTVNRIQLQGDVPTSFYVSVLTDNTARAYDPSVLVVRGNAGRVDVPQEVADTQVESDSSPTLVFNGLPDVYVFRFDGFVAGDYLKLRLAGSKKGPASFGGLLFDADLAPTDTPPGRAHPHVTCTGPATMPQGH